VDRIVVLVSSVPWNGDEKYRDRTEELVRRERDVELHVRQWSTEAEQRNFGLDLLRDCSFVLTFDPDEFLTASDREKLVRRLRDPFDYLNAVRKPLPCFRADSMVTYWRTLNSILSPADRHRPIVAVDPNQTRFTEHRQVPLDTQTVIPGLVIHHLSWVRTNREVKTKIGAFSHATDIKKDWYEQVWLAGRKTDVRPYGREVSAAVPYIPPNEIRAMFDGTRGV